MSEILNSGDAGEFSEAENNIEISPERLKEIQRKLAEAATSKISLDEVSAMESELKAAIAAQNKKKEALKNLEESAGEAPSASSGEGAEKHISPEAARASFERGKTIESIKKFLREKWKPIVAIVLVTVIAAGSGIVSHFAHKTDKSVPPGPNTENEGTLPSGEGDEDDSDIGKSVDLDGISGEDEETLGIYDGYGEIGMYLSDKKAGPYNFAAASEIAPLFENDECEMVKYTAHNQVESFADYFANVPEELQPESFKKLTILETDSKLEENLSDEEFSKTEKEFQDIIDQAFVRHRVINGDYDNAYMRLIDPSKPATHDNMELVHCVTHESNLEVTELYWVNEEGEEIGSFMIKLIPIYNEQGEIVDYKGCMQVVKERGSPKYEGLDEISEDDVNDNDDGGDEDKDDGGDEDKDDGGDEDKDDGGDDEDDGGDDELEKKNEEAIVENAGNRSDKQDLNNDVTPPTSLDEDRQNFDAIKEQQEKDKADKEAADRAAEEQARKEEEAKREAEKRRQEEEAQKAQASEAEKAREAEAAAKAEAAKKANEEEVARKQAEAAEAERKAAEEREAREKAAAEAEAHAAENEKEAEENSDATADDRADMFAEGDF